MMYGNINGYNEIIYKIKINFLNYEKINKTKIFDDD
jgi:hypothetical protein